MKKLLLVAILAFSTLTLTGCGQYSDGEREGTLIKFSNKGLFSKTWEGTLNLGGTKSVSDGKSMSTVANTWDFTVSDLKIVEQLKNKVGEQVDVHYNQEVIVAPWRGDTDSFVTGVK